MARDMYLVGVNEEELRPDPKPEGPKDFKGKWDNYWYHYKWLTIGVLFAVVVIVVLVVQMVTKDEPDYRLVLVTDQPMSQQVQTMLKAELEVTGLDLNGDGVVMVSIENLYMGGNSQMNMANLQKLPVLISAGDELFYALEPEYYEQYIKSHQDDEFRFFSELGLQGDDILEEGRLWNWKNGFREELMKQMENATDAARDAVPEDLYFGVRASSDEKLQEKKEQCLELLRAFARGTTLEESDG